MGKQPSQENGHVAKWRECLLIPSEVKDSKLKYSEIFQNSAYPIVVYIFL